LRALQNMPDTASLLRFITHVHAIKSASASIGATEVSAYAEQLEVAGMVTDTDFIRENLPTFAKHLAELINNIAAFLAADKREIAPL
jgi:hypothetical protein